MIFKRRQKQSVFSRIYNIIWPRMGWWRAIQYYKYRILRLPHSARDISMGMAAGCTVSWTPTFPFHILQCYIFCKIARANFPASLLGTVFGNPWTFPLLFIVSYNVGNLFLTLLGFDMALKIETDQKLFAEIFLTINVLLMTGLENIGNFFLSWIGIENFFVTEFSQQVLFKSYQYFYKILVPTLVGGYIMAVLTFPLFYYSLLYMIRAGRASRKAVQNKVHTIIEHRHERKEEKEKKHIK